MDSYNSEYNNILEDIETLTTGPEITGNTVVDTILNTDSVSSFRKKLTNTTYSAQAKNQIIKDKTLEKSYTIDGFELLDVTFADADSGYRADGTKFRFEDLNRIDAVDFLSNLSDSKKRYQPDYVSSMVGKPVDSLTEEDYRNVHDYQAIQLQKLVTDPNYVIENYDPLTTYTYNKAPVKLALKVVGKDIYGRDLVEAINPATGRHLSFDLSNNPYLNANFDIYKSLDTTKNRKNLSRYQYEPTLDTIKKTVTETLGDNDGRIGEFIDQVQANAYRSAARLLSTDFMGKVLGSNINQEKWKAIASNEEGQALADAWAGVKTSTRRDFAKKMLEARDAVEDGNYKSAIWMAVTQFDRMLADSAVQMGLMAAGSLTGGGIAAGLGAGVNLVKAVGTVSGAMAAATDQTLISMEDYKSNNNGKEMSGEEIAKTWAGNVALLIPETLMVGSGFSRLLPKSFGKELGIAYKKLSIPESATRIVGSSIGEGVQEMAQDTFNTYMTQDQKNPKSLTDIATSSDIILSGIAGGVMGAGLSGIGTTLGNLNAKRISAKDSKLANIVDANAPISDTDTTINHEVSSEALNKVASTMESNIISNTDTIEEQTTKLSNILDSYNELYNTKGVSLQDYNEATRRVSKLLEIVSSMNRNDKEFGRTLQTLLKEKNVTKALTENIRKSGITYLSDEEAAFTEVVVNKVSNNEKLDTDSITDLGNALGIEESVQEILIDKAKNIAKSKNKLRTQFKDNPTDYKKTTYEVYKDILNEADFDNIILNNPNTYSETVVSKSRERKSRLTKNQISKLEGFEKLLGTLASNPTLDKVEGATTLGYGIYALRDNIKNISLDNPGKGPLGTINNIIEEATRFTEEAFKFGAIDEVTRKNNLAKIKNLEKSILSHIHTIKGSNVDTNIDTKTNAELVTEKVDNKTISNWLSTINQLLSFNSDTSNTNLNHLRKNKKILLDDLIRRISSKELDVDTITKEIDNNDNIISSSKEELKSLLQYIKEYNELSTDNKPSSYEYILLRRDVEQSKKLADTKVPSGISQKVLATEIDSLSNRLASLRSHHSSILSTYGKDSVMYQEYLTLLNNTQARLDQLNSRRKASYTPPTTRIESTTKFQQSVDSRVSKFSKAITNALSILTTMNKDKLNAKIAANLQNMSKQVKKALATIKHFKFNPNKANSVFSIDGKIQVSTTDHTKTWLSNVQNTFKDLIPSFDGNMQLFLKEATNNPALPLLFNIVVDKNGKVRLGLNNTMALALDFSVREFFSKTQNINRIYPSTIEDAAASYNIDTNKVNTRQLEELFASARTNGVPVSTIATELGRLIANNLGLEISKNAPMDTYNKTISALGLYAIQYASRSNLTSITGGKFGGPIININKGKLVNVPDNFGRMKSITIDTITLGSEFNKYSSTFIPNTKQLEDINKFLGSIKGKEFVILDFESTGLDKVNDDIIQVSIREYDSDLNEVVTHEIVLDKGTKNIPEKFNDGSINPMYEYYQNYKNKKNRKEALQEILRLISNKTVVGHNVGSYDLELLKNNIKRELGIDFSPKTNGITVVDTLDAARLIHPELGKTKGNYKLTALGNTFGIMEVTQNTEEFYNDGQAHNATFDTKLTENVLKVLLKDGTNLTTITNGTNIRQQLSKDMEVLQQYKVKDDDTSIIQTDSIAKEDIPTTVLHTGGLLRLSKRQRNELEELSNVPYTLFDRDLIQYMLEHRHEVALAAGYVDNVDTLYRSAKESAIGKNNAIDIELDGITEAFNLGKEANIVIPRELGKNGRRYMTNPRLNPQTNKTYQRWLVVPKAQIKTYNVDLDSDTLSYAFAQMFNLIKVPNYQSKVDALVDKFTNMSATELDTFVKYVIIHNVDDIRTEYSLDVDIESRAQLIAFGNFLHKRAIAIENGDTIFTGYAPVELDAVASGIGIKILQFPNQEYLSELGATVGIIGDFNSHTIVEDSNPTSMHELFTAIPNFADAYIKPAQKFEGLQEADESTIRENISNKKYTTKFPVLETIDKEVVLDMYSTIKKIIDNLKTKQKGIRNLFKDPTMTYNYTAGERSITIKTSEGLLESYLDIWFKHKTTNNTLNNEEKIIVELVDKLATLYSKENNPTLEAKDFYEAIKKYRLSSIILSTGEDNKANVRDMFAGIIGVTLGNNIFSSVSSTYDFTSYNNYMIESSKIIQSIFTKLYDSRIESLKKAKGRDYITEEEKNTILKELKDILPTLPSLFGDTTSGILLTGIEFNPSTENNVSVTTTANNGFNNTINSYADTITYTDPGQSGAVIGIHSKDATAMRSTELVQPNLTTIFDATIVNYDMSTVAGRLGNRNTYLTNFASNLLEDYYNKAISSLTALWELDKSQGGTKDFNEWLNTTSASIVLGSSKELKGKTIGDVLKNHKELLERNNQARREAYGYMQDGEFIIGSIKSIMNTDAPIDSAFNVAEFKKEVDSNPHIITDEDLRQYIINCLNNNVVNEDTLSLQLGRVLDKEKDKDLIKAEQLTRYERGSSYERDGYIPNGKEPEFTLAANTTVEGRKQLIDTLAKLDEESGRTVDENYINYVKELLDIVNPESVLDSLVTLYEDGVFNSGQYNPITGTITIHKRNRDLDTNINNEESIRRAALDDKSLVEIYSHEQAHHIIEFGVTNAKSNSKLYRNYRALVELYNLARKHIDYTDFLPNNYDSMDDTSKNIYKTWAEKTYEYVFINKNIDEGLVEFVTHGITNPKLVTKLKSISIKKEAPSSIHERLFNILKGIFNIIFNRASFNETFGSASNMLKGITSARSTGNVHGDLLRLYSKMSNTNQKYIRRASITKHKAFQSMYDIIRTTVLNGNKYLSDKMFSKLFNRNESKSILHANTALTNVIPRSKLDVLNMARFSYRLLTDKQARKVAMGVIQTRAGLAQEGLLATTIRDMTKPDNGTMNLHDYNGYRSVIEKESNNKKNITAYSIKEAFNDKLTERDERILTDAILKTDLSCLLESYDLKTIKEIIGDDTRLNTEIDTLKGKLKSLCKSNNSYNTIINLSKTLAYYMITKKGNPAMFINSKTIVEHVFGNIKNKDLVNIVDQLTTMYSLTYTDIDTRKYFTTMDNKGLDFFMNLHKNYVKESYEGIDEDGTRFIRQDNIYKGYTKSVIDTSEDVIIESLDNRDKLYKAGYILQEEVQFNPHVSSTMGVYKRMFTTPKYRSGSAIAMAGVDATTVDLQYGMLELLGINNNSKKSIKTIFDEATTRRNQILKRYGTKELSDEDIRALGGDYIADRGMDGVVNNYKLTLDTNTRETLLNESTSGVEILSAMEGHKVRKILSRTLNTSVVDFLFEDASINMDSSTHRHKKLGIKYERITPNSTNKFIREAWKSLPDSIKQIATENELWIRGDWTLNAFGSPSMSLANTKLLANSSPYVKKAIAIAEQILRLVATTVRHVIVLYTPQVLGTNVLGNLLLQILTGSNPTKLLQAYASSIRDIKTYRDDNKAYLKLEAKKDAGKATSKDLAEMRVLEEALRNNPVHPLMMAGMDQAIVEDLNTFTSTNTAYLNKLLRENKALSKLPKAAKRGLQELYLTEGTFLYKIMNQLTQYSDLVSRAADYKMAMDNFVDEKGKPIPKYILSKGEKVLNEQYQEYSRKVIQNLRYKYVNYDLPQSPVEQYAQDMGFAYFTKYRKRIQHVIMNGIAKNPLNALMLLFLGHQVDFDTPMEESILNKPLYNNLANPLTQTIEALTPGLYHMYQNTIN